MTAAEVMAELQTVGTDQTKKTFLRHGAREPFFGVKVADLKAIVKRVKTNHPLALELYATGNSDAMYLAGLIADPQAMTKADLNRWVKAAYWHMLSEYTVPWVAAESRFAAELAAEWVNAKSEQVRAAGWSTYSSYVGITPDDDLDLDALTGLLARVKREIRTAPSRVPYTMNGFVIAVGGYVALLTELAVATAEAIGKVEVDMGDTACKVPVAADSIRKVQAAGGVGRKRKTARC